MAEHIHPHHEDETPHEHHDQDLMGTDSDTLAQTDEEFVAGSGRQIAGEDASADADAARRARQQWRNNFVKTALKEVVAPSTLIGLGAYGLSKAFEAHHGVDLDHDGLWSAAAGAAYYPMHTIRLRTY